MNRWHYIFLTTLLFGSAWVWYSRGPVTAVAVERGPQPAVDYPAPDFALITLTGEQISLAELRGQQVVLNFWATWCDPCRREMPALQATADLYADEVTVIGIDQGEPPATVDAFVEEYGLTYPILLDGKFEVSQQYSIRGLPTTFFIDADGVVRFLWVGEMNRITLAEGIAKIR